MSVLLKIHGALQSLGAAERRLAEFILESPREAIDATIEELARLSGASYATISRFCRKNGYSGFKEFKRALIDDIVAQQNREKQLESTHVDRSSSTEEVIAAVAGSSETILAETRTVVDARCVEFAVDVLIGARSILAVGSGTSGITARYAFSRLFRLGYPCSSEIDPVLFSMRAAVMGEGDVLLAVSSSGRTESVVKAAELARGRGATVVALSDFAISPLSRVADVTLCTTPRNVGIFMNVELPLLVGQVMLVDVLFAVASIRSPEASEQTYAATKRAGDELKRR